MTIFEPRVATRPIREAVELLREGYVPEGPGAGPGIDGTPRVGLTGYDRRIYEALLAAERVLGPDREYQRKWPAVAEKPVSELDHAELATWFTRTYRGERAEDPTISHSIHDGTLLLAFERLLFLEH